MSQPAVVEFEGVVKDYPLGPLRRGRLRAVDGVGFRVEPGEVVGLLGPNRAGKTTLVKVLLTLCRPTAGRAERFGGPVSDRRTLARVGYVHEAPAFPRYLTATQLLESYGALAQVSRTTLRQRVPALLERVGLADRGREPIARFSKGMVQRLGLAQALVNAPDLLVLDEPNEGLDLQGRRLVSDVVGEHRRRGGSVLLVSHVLPDVAQLCDRAAVLVGGRLAYFGDLAGLTGGPGRPLEEALSDLYKAPSS